jgi:hypothetical protein
VAETTAGESDAYVLKLAEIGGFIQFPPALTIISFKII